MTAEPPTPEADALEIFRDLWHEKTLEHSDLAHHPRNKARKEPFADRGALLAGVCTASRRPQTCDAAWLESLGKLDEPGSPLYCDNLDDASSRPWREAWRQWLIFAHLRVLQEIGTEASWPSDQPLSLSARERLCEQFQASAAALPGLADYATPPCTPGFVHDLVQYVFRGKVRDCLGQPERVGALVIEAGTNGEHFLLTLEKVPHFAGQPAGCDIYPHRDAAFIVPDAMFHRACWTALDAGLRLIRRCRDDRTEDVRWHLQRLHKRPPPSAVGGASAGGAFALGIARLFDEPTPAWSLEGVAITAEVRENGDLQPIAEFNLKLDAALQERLSPRVHTVIVAADQPEAKDLPDFRADVNNPGILEFRHGGHSFHLLRPRDLAHAAQLLDLERRTRWGLICEQRGQLDEQFPEERFFQRPWLHQRVTDWIEQAGRRNTLVLTAGPGFGKTTFTAHMLRRLPRCIAHVFHPKVEGGADFERGLASVCGQLQRMFALPDPPAGSLISQLDTLSHQADRLLASASDPLIIWFDGLNEVAAYPKFLPAGTRRLKFILTAQRDHRLGWLSTDERADEHDLEAHDKLSEEIRGYLDTVNRADRLGLDDAFLDVLTVAAQGNFLAAEFFVMDRPERQAELTALRSNPQPIPRGLQGRFHSEWVKLVQAAEAQGATEPHVAAVLGLVALARAPLSKNLLIGALKAADKSGQPARIGVVPLPEVLAQLDTILNHAQRLFTPAARQRGAAVYQFFHSLFRAEISRRVEEEEDRRREIHQVLASLTGGATVSAARQQYADKHRLAHLLGAEMGDEAGRLYAGELSEEQRRAATRNLAEFLVEGEAQS